MPFANQVLREDAASIGGSFTCREREASTPAVQLLDDQTSPHVEAPVPVQTSLANADLIKLAEELTRQDGDALTDGVLLFGGAPLGKVFMADDERKAALAATAAASSERVEAAMPGEAVKSTVCSSVPPSAEILQRARASSSWSPGGSDGASACGSRMSSLRSPGSPASLGRLAKLQLTPPKPLKEMNDSELEDEARVIGILSDWHSEEDVDDDDVNEHGCHSKSKSYSDGAAVPEAKGGPSSGQGCSPFVMRRPQAGGSPAASAMLSKLQADEAAAGDDDDLSLFGGEEEDGGEPCAECSGDEFPGPSSAPAGAGSSAPSSAHFSNAEAHIESWSKLVCKKSAGGRSGLFCATAASLHVPCCLEQFCPIDARSLHATTYGHVAAESFGPTQVRQRLHAAMWLLPREPLDENGQPDKLGRVCRIVEWTLPTAKGHRLVVCRAAWQRAMGGSANAHADVYALVLRGRGPADVECSAAAKQAVKLQTCVEQDRRGRNQDRTEYAAQWWVELLHLCDWMPNDNKLVLRGPGYRFYHQHVYGPVAKAAGLFFEYKSFMKGIKPALITIARELPECDASKLRFGRAERHSKFPECSDCQEFRAAYYAALASPSCSAQVKYPYNCPCYRVFPTTYNFSI